ncbi:MAG: leucine-rich repeat domain-containing protein [Treponema sp.]|nr:leucine-rich repeat domain-containing protein [Treponema sp.]
MDIHESGIPLEDSQDYEKIQIQAPANVLKNLNVISSVKVEGEDGGEDTGAESTNEPFFIMDTDTYGFDFPKCVTEIIIPNGMTTVDQIGLNYFPNLRTFVIPESVTSIGNSAFKGCSSLTSITIPNSVTSISEGAFRDCTSLTSITIPEGVTKIGNYAFYYCISLKTINYTGTEEQWRNCQLLWIEV